jgi:quinoprotein glucose dehydrogenase
MLRSAGRPIETCISCVAIAVALIVVAKAGSSQSRKAVASSGKVDWPVYGGSSANTHYSRLNQINRTNVSKLTLAWSYDSGERGGLETSPIIVDGVLYAYTPLKEVIALDAASGKLLWKFNSGITGQRPERGLSYWTDGHVQRILASIVNYLYALDAKTGKPISSFGDQGRIDLRENLRGDPNLQSLYVSSPGSIYKDLIIMGDGEPENLPAPPGDIRAYDVRTGQLRWTFHTIPHPGELGYNTWPKDAWTYSGAANNWTGMSVDTERGIVYVPTGSPATDWYGADRIGDNLFANSLIALNAETGKRIWHFQTLRHDLWDKDLPSPPTLVTVKRNGKDVPAVAQTSKQGFLFLFNRLDGTPLFPIEYRKYPASNVPGEVAAAEQPYPLKPEPFTRQLLTENDLTNRTPEAHQAVLEHFRKMINHGQFTPNGVGQETLMMPGWNGGAEYGGSAFDPATHIIYLNANEEALTETLVKSGGGSSGRGIYESQCAACHGQNRAGLPPAFPGLIDVEKRLTLEQILDIVQHGRGRMPGFPAIDPVGRQAVSDYIMGTEKEVPGTNGGAVTYNTTGYRSFVDPDGYPALTPPWGTLNAINLDTGEYVWKVPLGEYPALATQGVPITGSQNFGGPVVTDGGLLIIAATVYDKKLRIFDKSTGKLLWETVMPFSALATPATYEVKGKQYIVIASGGGRDRRGGTGGVYMAFSLP